jgi:formylglycine-generating enzyme required for sulfatase activity
MRPLRVFLCHASQDKPAVRELYFALKTEGWIDPWLDKAKILPGQDWEMVIEKAVDDSDMVVVCLSSQSITKEGFVQREIRYAYDMALEKPDDTIFLIPLRLDDCNVPRKLRTLHWVDYFGFDKENSYSDLLEVLKLRYEQKMRLEAEELERNQREQQAKHEVEELARKRVAEQATHEKAEREAKEKAEHEANELARKTAVEKVNREAKEKAEQEKREAKAKIEREINTTPIHLSPKRDYDSPIVITQMIFGLSVLVLFAWGIYTIYLSRIPKQPVAPPAVFSPTDMATPEPPTFTSMPFTPTPQPTETPIPPPTLAPIKGKDGMTLLYVPEGEFTMGSDSSHQSEEKPQLQVYLDSFWIDQTEVTNAMFKKCVDVGECTSPRDTNHFSNSSYANHPVIYVNWKQANAYCSWVDRRLPTETEWEKAARGTDGRTYPWGEGIDCDKANYYGCKIDTTPVGIYKSEKSPYGAYDMAGNVWEWVSSLYQPYPYVVTDGREDMSSSGDRVLRGGSWINVDDNVRSAYRNRSNPLFSFNFFGFRCARSP